MNEWGVCSDERHRGETDCWKLGEATPEEIGVQAIAENMSGIAEITCCMWQSGPHTQV